MEPSCSPRSDDHESLPVTLEDDLLRVRSSITSSSEPGQQTLHVLLRTAHTTVDATMGRSDGVSDAVRLALGIPATVREVQILLGGESIAEGSFEENGVEGGATIVVLVEEVSFEQVVDDIMALNPHKKDEHGGSFGVDTASRPVEIGALLALSRGPKTS